MAIIERLLLATILAFAACRMSTDGLKPKTDAECAAGEKACGYKCVSKSDPATGCGNAGDCSPCPDDQPNSYPACTSDFRCDFACASGWGNCDALPGCETQLLGGDELNCGACFRVCTIPNSLNGQCVAGTCVPLDFPTDGEPRGIVWSAPDDRVFWVDDGNQGEVVSLDGAGNSSPVAYGLDLRQGSPALSRIIIDWENVPPALYATGAIHDQSQGPDRVAVYQFDPYSPAPATLATPMWSDTERLAGERFFGIAILNGMVVATREAWAGPCWLQPPGSSSCTRQNGPEANGLTPFLGNVYYGYSDAGGTIAYMDAQFIERILVPEPGDPGVGSWPSRIAFFGSQAEWFWVDESNGNVWRVPVPNAPAVLIDSGSGPTEMDIQADDKGVVWTDREAGKIRAWRAYDDAIFDVGRGGEPRGVALSRDSIYWTDSAQWRIHRVAR